MRSPKSVILFPQTVFSLLTSHSDINREIVKYTVWLLPLLTFTAIAFMLEAYFIGLKKSAVLRNASLIALIFVFIPLVILTLKIQSVNLLWFSLTSYMVTLILVLASQIFSTQKAIDITQREFGLTRLVCWGSYKL